VFCPTQRIEAAFVRKLPLATTPRRRPRRCIAMAHELAEPDDAPITPGSRRRRPRRIAAAAEDSDGEGAVTPAAADEIATELTRLATTCSSDGTPTGPRHGGADDASRPWHGGRGLARAEAEAEAEPDPTQIHVHELKIAPQPRHVSSCLRAGHGPAAVGGASAKQATRCLGRSRARANPAGLRHAPLCVVAPTPILNPV